MYLTMQTQNYFTIHFFIQAFQTKEFLRQVIDKIMHIILSTYQCSQTIKNNTL